ncbi:MAG: hypothetical protein EZS28_044199, partial [Streblomastix strix]
MQFQNTQESIGSELIDKKCLEIRNIAPDISESELVALFGPLKATSISIQFPMVGQTKTAYLYFSNEKDSDSALEVANGRILNGLPLQILFRRNNPQSPHSFETSFDQLIPVQYNLIIRGLPSDTKRSEISVLFEAFHPIRIQQLPDISNPGLIIFIISFASKNNADKAMFE